MALEPGPAVGGPWDNMQHLLSPRLLTHDPIGEPPATLAALQRDVSSDAGISCVPKSEQQRTGQDGVHINETSAAPRPAGARLEFRRDHRVCVHISGECGGRCSYRPVPTRVPSAIRT